MSSIEIKRSSESRQQLYKQSCLKKNQTFHCGRSGRRRAGNPTDRLLIFFFTWSHKNCAFIAWCSLAENLKHFLRLKRSYSDVNGTNQRIFQRIILSQGNWNRAFCSLVSYTSLGWFEELCCSWLINQSFQGSTLTFLHWLHFFWMHPNF